LVERVGCERTVTGDGSLRLVSLRRLTPTNRARCQVPSCVGQRLIIKRSGMRADRNYVSQFADRCQITELGELR
jgi:hypothetical protein